jgi:hypothetical protein
MPKRSILDAPGAGVAISGGVTIITSKTARIDALTHPAIRHGQKDEFDQKGGRQKEGHIFRCQKILFCPPFLIGDLPVNIPVPTSH